MEEYLCAPVKVYSRYGEHILAPLGLDTPSRHLEVNKWQHFPSVARIALIIMKDGTNVIFKVVWDGALLEYARVDLKSTDSIIQFSAKSPSISCKYMLAPRLMKRFQVTFNCESEFMKACSLIASLGVKVKQARPTPSENSRLVPSHCLPLFGGQAPTQTPLQSTFSQTSMQDYNFSQSQWAHEVPARPDVLSLAGRSLQKPSTQVIEFMRAEDSFLKPNVITSSTTKASNPEAIPETTANIPILPTVNENTTNTPIHPTVNERTPTPIAVQPASNSCTSEKSSLTSSMHMNQHQVSMYSLNSKSPTSVEERPIVDAQLKARSHGAKEILDGASRNVEGQRVLKQPDSTVSSLASAVTPHISKALEPASPEKLDVPKKLHNDENKHATFTELKISKKLIKQKLKDKKFMKWVSKVEAVLQELAKSE
ncbi:REC114 (YMR133W) [Zygosaccharomyces parabailii]|nr:REC114 (YMR133W) [Zygosaccharomyces parabailii]CDH13104.1 uncharacterized protein ZBAI_04890 [Zygosaccharomyces bailii ISA1307]